MSVLLPTILFSSTRTVPCRPTLEKFYFVAITQVCRSVFGHLSIGVINPLSAVAYYDSDLSNAPLKWMIDQFSDRFPWVQFENNSQLLTFERDSVVGQPMIIGSSTSEGLPHSVCHVGAHVVRTSSSADSNAFLYMIDKHPRNIEWVSELFPRIVISSQQGTPRRKLMCVLSIRSLGQME